jgi:hypothetical protein
MFILRPSHSADKRTKGWSRSCTKCRTGSILLFEKTLLVNGHNDFACSLVLFHRAMSFQNLLKVEYSINMGVVALSIVPVAMNLAAFLAREQFFNICRSHLL